MTKVSTLALFFEVIAYKTKATYMKKDKKKTAIKGKQTGKNIKKGLPQKNAMTDNIKNAVLQIPGLNQSKTTRDDLFPSDGDNLTK